MLGSAQKTKGCIFYTDNQLDESIARPVRESILESGLPIVSATLQPMDFGKNYVVRGERGYITMTNQILVALEHHRYVDYVFFCEHDVLYNKSHFDFVPPRDDIFYYNANVWRWMVGTDTAVRHDRMLPLSVMCCSRKLAMRFYKFRMKQIDRIGAKEFENSQSEVMRRWGFEPGTKKKKRGGLTDDDFDTWYSVDPVIDIRHKGTFSPAKCTLESFKHMPENWQEISIKELPICNLVS